MDELRLDQLHMGTITRVYLYGTVYFTVRVVGGTVEGCEIRLQRSLAERGVPGCVEVCGETGTGSGESGVESPLVRGVFL